jgi:hypothetical protein
MAAEPRPRNEPAFRENAINEKILPNLTAEDLRDLGVGTLDLKEAKALLDELAA